MVIRLPERVVSRFRHLSFCVCAHCQGALPYVSVDGLSQSEEGSNGPSQSGDSNMYDTEIEARVDREIASFLDDEYAARGDKLYQWYRNYFLAQNNRHLPATIGLAPYDKAIVRFVLERCPFAKRFVEVGAGIAQESMLLAMMGMPTCAIETNQDNFDMMLRLLERLERRLDPGLPARMKPINDFFPAHAAEYIDSETIVVFPTLSWGINAAVEQEIFNALQAAGGVILSVYDFFRHRAEQAEQEELVAQFCSRGFDKPVVVHAWKGLEMGFRYNKIVFMKRMAS